MHARLVTGYLVLGLMIYATIGVAGLAAPSWLMALVGVELHGASAFNEVRAVYGGQMLALALVMALGLGHRPRRRWTLTLFVAGVAAMGLARLLSLALDGAPNAVAWALWAAELSGALVGAALLASWPGGARTRDLPG